ncbi:histidine kinase [Pseudoglutamicibacter albus]|uniref:histidine kinase n=1 Tax=Pseudoglutamicibacter albus TaxID=98671 RepID=UPI003610B90F
MALFVSFIFWAAGPLPLGPHMPDPESGEYLQGAPALPFWPLFPYAVRRATVLLVGLVLCAAWAIRRYKPGAALVTAVIACLVQVCVVADRSPMLILVPPIIYSSAAHGSRWVSNTALVAGLLGSIVAVVFFMTHDVEYRSALDYAAALIGHWLVVAVAWLLGRLSFERRARFEAEKLRMKRLIDEQIREREFAAADERRRIAREMHDVVAHSLSVIVTQADGGRYAAVQRPEVACEVLETISQTGREALTEMRSLLGVLRDEGDEARRAPAPGFDRLDELAYTASASGIETSIEWKHSPAGTLPPGAELAVYRIVQEALTNVRKHAVAPTRTDVVLTWMAGGLAVTVANDSLPPRGPQAQGASQTQGVASADASDAPPPVTVGVAAALPSSGRGQVGMRERAELYGGKVAFSVLPGAIRCMRSSRMPRMSLLVREHAILESISR